MQNLRWTNIPFRVDSHLAPSIPGIHLDPDQNKELTEDEWMDDVDN